MRISGWPLALAVVASSMGAPTAYVAYTYFRKVLIGGAIDWSLIIIAWSVAFAFSFLLTAASVGIAFVAIRKLNGLTDSNLMLLAFGWITLLGLGVWVTLDYQRAALIVALASCNAILFVVIITKAFHAGSGH